MVLMRSFEVLSSYNNPYSVFWPGVWEGQKWVLIGQYVLRALMSSFWGGLWLLAIVIFNAATSQMEKEGNGLSGSIYKPVYYFLFFYLCLSTLKIEWLLGVSFYRLLYLLAPAVVFVMFYTVGERE